MGTGEGLCPIFRFLLNLYVREQLKFTGQMWEGVTSPSAVGFGRGFVTFFCILLNFDLLDLRLVSPGGT